MNQEIFILIEKQIRKVYLFNSLYRKQRMSDGYLLKSFDDVKSLSIVNESPTILSESYLISQPFVLRILFNFLFRERHNEYNRHASEVVEKLIDLKTQKPDDFSQIKTMASHPTLPVLFLAQ